MDNTQTTQIDSKNFIRVDGQKSPFKVKEGCIEWIDKFSRQTIRLPIKQLTELADKSSS